MTDESCFPFPVCLGLTQWSPRVNVRRCGYINGLTDRRADRPTTAKSHTISSS